MINVMELESIKRIASQLDMPNVSEVLESRLTQLECEQTRIVIAGGANVGKTTLINALANTDLEVSSIPTTKTARITYKGSGKTETIDSDSKWLQGKGLELWELSDADLRNEPTLGEFGLHFIHSDVCIMLLNSMSALSRSEISQLEVLEQLGIPTLLVLSKADQVNGNDYLEVEKYVEQKTAKYSNIKVLTSERNVHVKELAEKVREVINELLDEANPKVSSRAALSRLFETEAIASLYEACNKKIESANEANAKVEFMTNDKKSKLSDTATIWLKLQTTLSQRKNDTATKIKEVFAKKKQETIRQLSHNVELCGDVKLYWEKELPYRLEDVMRTNSQAASQLINADVMNTINWLNLEIKKSFNKSLNSIQPITCTIEPDPFIPTENPEISDNKKMRIVARVGTAATVIAAGTMFATMGISGIVMATGMMAGIGAEFFMNRKQSESKEKVQSLIPQMVDQAQQKLSINISDNLNKAYSELIKNLQSFQGLWMEEAERNIEKERQIALYNCKTDADKWIQCMHEINTLSEKIINNKL